MWLDRIPFLLREVFAEWSLDQNGAPLPGSHASLVIPVLRADGSELILKLAPTLAELRSEAESLLHWAGSGAILVAAVDFSRAALLMERVTPGTPLYELCLTDDRAATVAVTEVIWALRSVSGDKAPELEDLSGWIDRLNEPVTSRVPELSAACARAYGLGVDLLTDSSQRVVLHGDLHHWNVLHATRSAWLAIDPKGLMGPPAAELAAFLRNPRRVLITHDHPDRLLADRIDVIVEHLHEDPRRIVAWAYVLAVLAAYWSWEDGEGDDDTRRWLVCADLLLKLARRRGAA